MWGNTSSQNNNEPPPPSWFGFSSNLMKSVVLTVAGLIIHLAIFFLKRGKDQRLQKMIKEKEEEKQRRLEEEWNKLNNPVEPEFFLLKEIDARDYEEVKDYDGEINGMTFNLIKSSKAFDKQIIDDDDNLSLVDT
mmetsp:Transcript_13768/g.13464  ORF Transcript_13768/g.13464 Transcript_13768/m.13464 type:complete len:135 (+) Transcript_13768:208-612(+)|eukprot:CAMPEP_0170549740 /NCGR_PEP_ID=MMETSP0211-20121228/7888_1 /TAXON_ID=311385 /ORGANISM="Pseudokeronopsis sp., Strain OXSARD2" /LENGTH=134 /DNA_ID=CAMNT_0010855935 /DNA_START=404 /DNA_END=808 /DNA_ORIENTATION=+